ncbi:hypothetical protein Tco_0232302 [Tanacetum coccineum]
MKVIQLSCPRITQTYKLDLPQTTINLVRRRSNAETKLWLQDGKAVEVRTEEALLILNDLALNVDHVFEADECDAFDFVVDEVTSTDHVHDKLTPEDRISYDEAGTSYGLKYSSEVAIGYKIPYARSVKSKSVCSCIDGHVLVTPITHHTSSSNTQKHEVHQKVQQINVPVIHSTGVNTSTEASGSKPRSNTKKNRILPAKTENKKKVEDHPRTNKSVWTKVNRVDSSISSKRVVINSNSESVCKTCNKCLNSASHEMCVVNILNSVNATPTVKIVLNKGKQIWKPKGKLSDNSLNKTKQVWKATGKLFANVGYQWRSTGKKVALGKLNCGYQWRPTGKKFALGELCPLTKLSMQCSIVVQVILWYMDSGCSKHMTGNRSKLKNFVEKFIGSVRFGNDHFGAIMGYGDYVIGDSVISRVYYVEGLGHNLFSIGQFCDYDLELAFRKHSCFVRDINVVDLLKGRAIRVEFSEELKELLPDEAGK